MKAGRPVLVRSGDQAFEVTVAADGSIHAGGTTWSARPLGGSAWLIASRDGQGVAHVYRDGSVLWVHAEGEVHLLEVGAATRTRARATHATDLSAPMPAVVRAVRVAVGDRVKAGDVLLVLEAMKMEMPVRAPREGTVSAVRCQAGELVQPGVPLVELE